MPRWLRVSNIRSCYKGERLFFACSLWGRYAKSLRVDPRHESLTLILISWLMLSYNEFSHACSWYNLLCRKLTRPPFLRTVDWSKWHVFWAEENVVPKRHPDSFYRQAQEAFISKVLLLFIHLFTLHELLASLIDRNGMYGFGFRLALHAN